jgi:hypothetical protein
MADFLTGTATVCCIGLALCARYSMGPAELETVDELAYTVRLAFYLFFKVALFIACIYLFSFKVD